VKCGYEQMIKDAVMTHFKVLFLIGNNVTGTFHNQFEVLCGFEQMIENDDMT
jgi:hypothetical protein